MTQFEERLKRRESLAWRELYDRHMREIYGYVLHLVGGDAAAAEEIVQETGMNGPRLGTCA